MNDQESRLVSQCGCHHEARSLVGRDVSVCSCRCERKKKYINLSLISIISFEGGALAPTGLSHQRYCARLALAPWGQPPSIVEPKANILGGLLNETPLFFVAEYKNILLSLRNRKNQSSGTKGEWDRKVRGSRDGGEARGREGGGAGR